MKSLACSVEKLEVGKVRTDTIPSESAGHTNCPPSPKREENGEEASEVNPAFARSPFVDGLTWMSFTSDPREDSGESVDVSEEVCAFDLSFDRVRAPA